MSRNFWSAFMSLFACAAVAATGFGAEIGNAPRSTSRPVAARHLDRTAAKEQKRQVTLAISGAADQKSADLLTNALQQNGWQVKVREEKNQPCELTTSIAPNTDLSAASKAVMSVETSQKSAIPPSFDFVLFAPLTKEKAKQAMDRLRTLNGVDTQHSRANIDKGELWVRINGSSHVTPDDIHNAIRAAGIDAHFMKERTKSS